jgi:hypothetical protein
MFRRLAPVALLVLAACGGDDSGTTDSAAPTSAAETTAAPAATDAPTTTTEAPYEPTRPALTDVAVATVEGPITGGLGQVVLGVSPFDVSTWGYTETEFFVRGTASSYTSDTELSTDGNWSVAPYDQADYATRIVVRAPQDPSLFNGTVMVEWLNVTAGLDVSPSFDLAKNEILRSGMVWIGVSAQRVGVEGGGNPTGAPRVLKIADPERYGSLNHPGDDYSYDMFSQIGALVWNESSTLLGDLVPERVIAAGESQSAFRLTSYINALAPLHDVYNAYLVHSRGARAANLLSDPRPNVPGPEIAQIRDVGRPVLVFSAETDVVGDRLGYRRAEQPETDNFRSWEVTGTAHADAYSLGISETDTGDGAGDDALFAAMLDAPSSVYFGIVTCEKPINAGPHTYVLRAAVRALDTWVRTGVAPAPTPKLAANADLTGFEVDANGNALGGIRTPHVDVPVAALSGLGQSGESFCGLFGTTTSFTDDQLAALYTDKADFQAKWDAAVDAAVAAGAVLPEDADAVKASAEGYPLP